MGISVSKEGFAAQNSNIKKFSADVISTIHSLSRLSSISHSFPFQPDPRIDEFIYIKVQVLA